MAVKSVKDRPIGTNLNTATDSDTWIRPDDWLALPTPTAHQMVGLFAVYNDDTQYLALSATAAGNYTVDWGDGTVDNWTSAAVASHTYNYTTLSSAVSSRGYKMAIIKVYPQSGTLTALNITNVIHPSRVSTNYSYNWLDIWLNTASLTTLTIGSGVAALPPKMLEQVRIDAWAKTTYSDQFSNCHALQSVVLANSSATVISTTSMFNACHAIKKIPLFNTASVTSMNNMFQSCSSLETVPLFNTVSATNMNSMFTSCTSLKTVPLFNTASVTTSMSNMFSGCTALLSVPLFSTANVTAMDSMFSTCRSLLSVPLFSTANVTTMASMFSGCTSLKTVPLFNTANVTTMNGMFNGCISLLSVPLFNTANVTIVNFMFQNCYSINSISAMDFSKASSISNYGTPFSILYQLSSSPVTLPPISTSFQNSKLSATAINTVFTNLVTKPGAATVSSASGSGSTQTYNTSAGHGFIVGQLVTVTGLTPSGYNVTSTAIVTVPTTTSFTTAGATTGASSGTGSATIPAPIITVTGNPGAATCTTSIATTKGWTVTV